MPGPKLDNDVEENVGLISDSLVLIRDKLHAKPTNMRQ